MATTVPDLLADAIRRSAPKQSRAAVLGAIVSVVQSVTDAGVVTGAAGVTVDIDGALFNANGVLASFNRSVVSPGVPVGSIVQCNYVGGQLIVADVVTPVGD